MLDGETAPFHIFAGFRLGGLIIKGVMLADEEPTFRLCKICNRSFPLTLPWHLCDTGDIIVHGPKVGWPWVTTQPQ